MPTVSFTQSVTPSGQIALSLFSNDLPAGGFTFSLAFNYTGTGVSYDNVSFSGSSTISATANYAGSVGTVNITGSVAPLPGAQFATILFDAAGKGTFNTDITNFKINGSSLSFVDPVPYNFSILGETVSVQANGSAAGTYNPLDSFFGTSYTLKVAPQHGSVVFGDAGNPSAWKYAPANGYYGADTFTLKVTDAFDSKEKIFAVNVSPVGTSGNDEFHSSTGNYNIDGGAGTDTLVYSGKSTNFSIAHSDNSTVITDQTGAEGVNTLVNFERLVFSDGAIAYDLNGSAGQAYRIYQAAFNRAPDVAGLGYWIAQMDRGATLKQVAQSFINSSEFKTLYGSTPSHADIIGGFYQNVLHRTPDKGGFDYWVGVFDAHPDAVADILASFSESPENQAALIGATANGIAYQHFNLG